MPDKEPHKKAIDYNVPIRDALNEEQKIAEEDGDLDTTRVIRRMKVGELNKLVAESDRLELEEIVEQRREKLRTLKTRRETRQESTAPTQDNGEQENVRKQLLQPETLKILKEMKPQDREELLMSVSMVLQGSGGKGMGSILPFLMMAKQQTGGGGGGITDLLQGADKLLSFYTKGKEEAIAEMTATAPALPENITVAAPQKDGLAQWLDDEATNLMKAALTKALHPPEPVAATAPEVGQPLDFPVKMIYDKERGEWYPSIVRNLDEYYKIEDRRQKRDKEAKDEKRDKEREDSVMKEVVKPLVKKGVELMGEAGEDLKARLKKNKDAAAPPKPPATVKQQQQQDPAAAAQPPKVQTMPCTSKDCKGNVTVTAVDGKWPETANCDTCAKPYAMKKPAQ